MGGAGAGPGAGEEAPSSDVGAAAAASAVTSLEEDREPRRPADGAPEVVNHSRTPYAACLLRCDTQRGGRHSRRGATRRPAAPQQQRRTSAAHALQAADGGRQLAVPLVRGRLLVEAQAQALRRKKPAVAKVQPKRELQGGRARAQRPPASRKIPKDEAGSAPPNLGAL